jgi:hypothetical protein
VVFGTSPLASREGVDVPAVLYSSDWPALLTRLENETKDGGVKYGVVGEAYAEGFMHGEVLERQLSSKWSSRFTEDSIGHSISSERPRLNTLHNNSPTAKACCSF